MVSICVISLNHIELNQRPNSTYPIDFKTTAIKNAASFYLNLGINMDWLLISIGLFTGFLIGLTGIGGGAMISLILLFLIKIPANATVGTALLFAAITKFAAVRIYHNQKLIDWTVVSIMWIGSLSASVVTIIWLSSLSTTVKDISSIKQIIAGAILVAIMSLFLQPTIQILSERRFIGSGPELMWSRIFLTIMAGAALGMLVTLTSVGLGALGLIILTQLYPTRMTPPSLVATNLAHAIPLALFAGSGHIFLGNVNFSTLFSLLLGSILGATLGALLASAIPHPSLRTILSATLWIFGLPLWWSILPST